MLPKGENSVASLTPALIKERGNYLSALCCTGGLAEVCSIFLFFFPLSVCPLPCPSVFVSLSAGRAGSTLHVDHSQESREGMRGRKPGPIDGES